MPQIASILKIWSLGKFPIKVSFSQQLCCELSLNLSSECRNLLDEPSIGRSRSNARELRRPKTKTRAERQRRINASNAGTVGGQSIIETGGGDTSPSDCKDF